MPGGENGKKEQMADLLKRNELAICLYMRFSLEHTLCSFEHYSYTCSPVQGFSSSNFTFIGLTEQNYVTNFICQVQKILQVPF